LIDICSTPRDKLDSIKGQLQEFKSALRRGEYEEMRTTIRKCTLSVKTANKDGKKSVIVKKSESTLVDSSDVALFLLEVREVTISLLQSLPSFMPKQIVMQRAVSGLLSVDYFRKAELHAKRQWATYLIYPLWV
jgi:Arabidopsis protein of unknown function